MLTGALYKLLMGHVVCRGVRIAPGLGPPALYGGILVRSLEFIPTLRDRAGAGDAFVL
jgi:hypothetical protein